MDKGTWLKCATDLGREFVVRRTRLSTSGAWIPAAAAISDGVVLRYREPLFTIRVCTVCPTFASGRRRMSAGRCARSTVLIKIISICFLCRRT